MDADREESVGKERGIVEEAGFHEQSEVRRFLFRLELNSKLGFNDLGVFECEWFYEELVDVSCYVSSIIGIDDLN